LIVLGASLSRYRLRPSPMVVALSLTKLMVSPALVWLMIHLLPGLDPTAKVVLVLLAACPAGVNILAFARTPDDSRDVGSMVSLSTLLAAVTMPLWLIVAHS